MKDFDLTTLKSSFDRYFKSIYSKKPFVYLFEFAGPIGAGKTATSDATVSFLEECKINKNFKIYHINEDIYSDENKKAISDFYSGKGDAAELENIICGNRIKSLIETINVALSDNSPSIIISDRAVEEDCAFVMKLKRDCPKKQYETIDKLEVIILNISKFLATLNHTKSRIVHNVIYLNPGLETAIDRIRHRGRPDEQQINIKKLRELTTDPQAFENGKVHIIENKNLDIEETALMSFEKIIWECASPSGKPKMPLHKILVSFYGVPGSGKTFFVKALSERLASFRADGYDDMPDFAAAICDESDEDDIMGKQEAVYEGDSEALDADSMQKLLDERRIWQFEELDDDHMCAFTFTDIGPETSAIFQKFTGSKEDKTYAAWFFGRYDMVLNVLVTPGNGDLNVVRDHIKERGRPGEYDYFTVDRLSELSKELESRVCGPDSKCLLLQNNYSMKSVDDMFHLVMQFIAFNVIGYCKDEAARDKR